MKELIIGKRITEAFMRSTAYCDGAGSIFEASDNDIDGIPDEEWITGLVDGLPFYDIGIPQDELLAECKITEKDLDEIDLDEDECIVLEDGKEIQFIDDINDGFTFVTLRLFYNQNGVVRRIQYVGHLHDDFGCDEILLVLPTVYHERCFTRMLNEYVANGLFEQCQSAI